MEVAVTIRTRIEFEDLDDISEAQEMLIDDMSPDEILALAQNQGSAINVDVD